MGRIKLTHLDSSPINHNTWSVESSHCHDCTRHLHNFQIDFLIVENVVKWITLQPANELIEKCGLTFLSQPGMEILPSYHWADMTVSMLSAIKSLDCKLKHIPLVPMEIASLTPTVLNRNPTMPASTTPSLTASESCNRCILQVFPSYQTEDIPTCGLDRSSSERPTPWRIAWDPPWDFGSVMRELYLLSLWLGGAAVVWGGGVAVTAEEEGVEVAEDAFRVSFFA